MVFMTFIWYDILMGAVIPFFFAPYTFLRWLSYPAILSTLLPYLKAFPLFTLAFYIYRDMPLSFSTRGVMNACCPPFMLSVPMMWLP